jgi:hypothetical protein
MLISRGQSPHAKGNGLLYDIAETPQIKTNRDQCGSQFTRSNK